MDEIVKIEVDVKMRQTTSGCGVWVTCWWSSLSFSYFFCSYNVRETSFFPLQLFSFVDNA